MSVRGSAPDAALYWYARIITAGGDPLYVARRCLAIASEDVGNADPRAMAGGNCGLGLLLLALARRKVNAPLLRRLFTWPARQKATLFYTAFKAALADARERPDYDVPVHLRNAPTKLMKEMGYGRISLRLMMKQTLMLPVRFTSRRK